MDQTLLRPSQDDLEDAATTVGSPPSASLNEEHPSAFGLGEAYERYLADSTHAWSSSTRQAYETTRSVVVSVLGVGTPINDISRGHARELVEALRLLPRNAVKLFPKLSLAEAIARARADESIERISAANANAYLGNFSTFMNWAVNEEIIVRNPARGLRLPDQVAARDKRHPFSSKQLKQIFGAPLYTGCVDGDYGWLAQGHERPRNARYWVPLIALHTGMRLNEICQLDVTDIRPVAGVWCIAITRSSLIGSDDKKLKTGASERLIPIHETLLTLGLVRYSSAKKGEGHSKLFHDIDPGSRGVRAVTFSKWFTRFLRASRADALRTSFHSFRHNFRDELRIARIDPDVAMALGGWSIGKALNRVSESYGSGHRIDALQNAIQSLQFNDVDFSHLLRNSEALPSPPIQPQ